jgi:hypothetical protein
LAAFHVATYGRFWVATEVPKSLAKPTHDSYFTPPHEEFAPRTLWSLNNAFSGAAKTLDPIPQQRAAAQIGMYFQKTKTLKRNTMGNGSTSSQRCEKDRKTTLQEQITYRQGQAMQLRSERDQLPKTCERLTLKLGQSERMLERCERLFGFQIPQIPEELDHEPFSQ